MPAATASDTEVIFIPLLDEGTFVMRPTSGYKILENVFKVLPTSDYAEADEVWQFPPGSVVFCEIEMHDGDLINVAKRLFEPGQ